MKYQLIRSKQDQSVGMNRLVIIFETHTQKNKVNLTEHMHYHTTYTGMIIYMYDGTNIQAGILREDSKQF